MPAEPQELFALYPDDHRDDYWLFFADDSEGKLVVRPEYEDLQCPRCGKVDAGRAIERGIASFSVRSRLDWIGTHDNWILVSRRFVELCERAGITGFATLTIPGSPNHFVFVPTLLVPTDEANAGFVIRGGQCSACGRPQEKVLGPLAHAMKIPVDDNVLFASPIWCESRHEQYRTIFAKKSVVDVFKRNRISGIAPVSAFGQQDLRN